MSSRGYSPPFFLSLSRVTFPRESVESTSREMRFPRWPRLSSKLIHSEVATDLATLFGVAEESSVHLSRSELIIRKYYFCIIDAAGQMSISGREKGERKEEKSGEKNCFPEGRVGKGKVSSYHRWIHLVRTRYESWIDFFEDRTIELDSIVNYIFIVWELIDIIIREDGIEFIMRDPYVVQFIPFYIDYLVKNLNDTHPFQRTASN